MIWPETIAEDNKSFNLIIETPSHSRNKFSYDKESGLFKLTKVLPSGTAFPCHMGFICNTLGEDGDPLDALIIMEEFTFPGCFVEGRLLGALTATQKEKGQPSVRNDRFVFVPTEMKEHDHYQHITDINQHKLEAIVDFFKLYNSFYEVKFNDHQWLDATKAMKLIMKNIQ